MWTKLCVAKNREDSIPTRNIETTQSNHDEVGSIPLIGECLISAGLSEDTADIIMQSWRSSTRKQYGSYFKRWVQFCHQQQIDKINPSLGEIMLYLTRLHNEGLSYSAINTAKSMLSTMFEVIHKTDIGRNILVKRFMKGIFHIKPVLPKTLFTWDVKIVLNFLGEMDNKSLTLRLLSIKLTLLIILTTGQRCQTLKALDIRNMEVTKTYMWYDPTERKTPDILTPFPRSRYWRKKTDEKKILCRFFSDPPFFIFPQNDRLTREYLHRLAASSIDFSTQRELTCVNIGHIERTPLGVIW